MQTDDAMLRVSIIHVTVVDCNEIKEYYIVILKYYLKKNSKTKWEIEDKSQLGDSNSFSGCWGN